MPLGGAVPGARLPSFQYGPHALRSARASSGGSQEGLGAGRPFQAGAPGVAHRALASLDSRRSSSSSSSVSAGVGTPPRPAGASLLASQRAAAASSSDRPPRGVAARSSAATGSGGGEPSPLAAAAGRLSAAALPWVCPLTVVAALAAPWTYLWFDARCWAPGLSVIMFTAAIKLRVADFARLVEAPFPVLLGLSINWCSKPLLALGIARLVALLGLSDPALATGIIMIGCVTPSPLSNYATSVSGGNTALSVTVGALSTLAGVALTPLLAAALLGQGVDVSPAAMAKTITQIIVVPTVLGLALNESAPAFTATRVAPFGSLTALIVTSLVLGGATAVHAPTLLSSTGLQLLPFACLFHAAAYAFAFVAARAAGAATADALAVTMVTGMQSSTTATVLCSKYFPAMADAVVPTVLSTIVMANSGLALASWVQARAAAAKAKEPQEE